MRAPAAAVAAVLLLFTSACGSTDKKAPTEQQKASSAKARTSTITVQFGVDAGFITASTLGPGVLSDQNLVQNNGHFTEAYQLAAGTRFGSSDTRLVGDEITQNIAILQRVDRLQSAADRSAHGPALPPDAVARLVVVQELIDAGYLNRTAVGLSSSVSLVEPGAAIDTWFTAHSADPLHTGATTTVGQEAGRVVTLITRAENGEL